MRLKDYLKKYNINKTDFCYACKMGKDSLDAYCSGKRRPRLERALLIQEASDGCVKVEDLRGKE